MIRSMTGYGSAEATIDGVRFTVEMRSVNHRFAEIVVRLPRDLSPLEDQARAAVAARVGRGRVDVAIGRDAQARRARSIRADVDMAQGYLAAFQELQRTLNLPGEITLAALASLPDVVRVEEDRADLDALWPPLRAALDGALGALVGMRADEGRRLQRDMAERLERLRALAAEVHARAAVVVQDYAERLRARIQELLGDVTVDEARLAMEVATFAERSDITEELTRLGSHVEQFRATLAGADGPVGRTLEFILQEMGREVNTIGSKANDVAIARAVIAMKGILESLREQVQNVE